MDSMAMTWTTAIKKTDSVLPSILFILQSSTNSEWLGVLRVLHCGSGVMTSIFNIEVDYNDINACGINDCDISVDRQCLQTLNLTQTMSTTVKLKYTIDTSMTAALVLKVIISF